LDLHSFPTRRSSDLFFEKIWGTVYSKRRFANVPFEWRELADGVHDLEGTAGSGQPSAYKLAVRKDSDYWFFLRYDVSQEELSKQDRKSTRLNSSHVK